MSEELEGAGNPMSSTNLWDAHEDVVPIWDNLPKKNLIVLEEKAQEGGEWERKGCLQGAKLDANPLVPVAGDDIVERPPSIVYHQALQQGGNTLEINHDEQSIISFHSWVEVFM